jgi:spermidine/putrescine transport system ATP-binding protein
VTTAKGLTPVSGACHWQVAQGDAVAAFVRPEVATPGRMMLRCCRCRAAQLQARVESLLFDGANSAVLLQEVGTSKPSSTSPCRKPASSPT